MKTIFRPMSRVLAFISIPTMLWAVEDHSLFLIVLDGIALGIGAAFGWGDDDA
jgi:hypothetical protein